MTTLPRTLSLLLRTAALGALLFLTARAAPEAKKSYNLPAGEAASTLKQFSEASGRETLFAAEAVRGVKTAPVKGEFTPKEALDRMLDGTGLTAVQDEKTGALAVKRDPGPNAARAAQTDSARPDQGKIENGVLVLEKVEVTGSRIRSILGEQGASPMLSWTQTDIENSGVTSLADLRNLIPQLSVGSAAQFDGNSSGSAPEGRLLFNLRGITGNNTLLLVDGRRLTKTGQRGVAESYEATGIPLSAIERVEVLLDGGSAVYGADAIGGVVNVITKKNYSGSELEFDYDNTFDKDAANSRWSLSTAARKGKWFGRAFAAYQHQNAMARRDRWWLSSDDRRYIGGINSTANNLPVGGRVTAVSGVLPGIGAASAYIPTNSDGKNLTIADFANAPATPVFDAGQYQNALNPYDRINFTAHAGYDWRPWARFSADYSFARIKSNALDNPVTFSSFSSSVNPLLNTVVPANYPGNPFGVPIRVQKYLWELGPLYRRYRMDSFAVNLGVRGDLPHDWRYEAGASWAKSTPGTLDQVFQLDLAKTAELMRAASPLIVLNNSLTYGAANPDGTYEALFGVGANREFPQTYTYMANASGPVYQLPAGQVQVAVGAEMREEYILFDRQNFAAATESAQPNGHRTVTAEYAELSVPVVSPEMKRRIPLVHTLTLAAAGRADHYNDFGNATKPRYSAQYRPVKWLMLRGSRSEAFKVPVLVDLTRPANTQAFNVPATGSSSILDIYRKNEPFTGPILNTTGGNPNLRPENSVSTNFGVIIESPFKALKGFSASADWWDLSINDRVGSLSFQERLEFFPEMFTRLALTPADQAAGFTVGRLNAVDNRSINISFFHTAGVDFSLRYDRRTPWGDVNLKVTMTQTNVLEARTLPDAAPSASTSPVTRPRRGVATLVWSKWGLGASTSTIWQDRFRTSATSTVEFASTTQWNANCWYDFDTGTLHRKTGWAGRWLQGVRVSAGLINAFNLEPALSPTGGTAGSIDARLRRYTLTFRKKL